MENLRKISSDPRQDDSLPEMDGLISSDALLYEFDLSDGQEKWSEVSEYAQKARKSAVYILGVLYAVYTAVGMAQYPEISGKQQRLWKHVFNVRCRRGEGHGTRLPPRDVIDGCTVLIIVSRLAPIFTTLFPVLFLRTLAGNVLVGEWRLSC